MFLYSHQYPEILTYRNLLHFQHYFKLKNSYLVLCPFILCNHFERKLVLVIDALIQGFLKESAFNRSFHELEHFTTDYSVEMRKTVSDMSSVVLLTFSDMYGIYLDPF